METLTCSYNENLIDLELAGNTALATLTCSHNAKLTDLNLAGNTALATLTCSYNENLIDLDLTGNPALETLTCSNNTNLTDLDLSNNTALKTLTCTNNVNLTDLDLSNNIDLESLTCSSTPITTLDLSKNTALTSLNCDWANLTSLSVSANTNLKILDCSGTKISTLDLSNNAALETLTCSNTQLATLDLSNNTALETLTCTDNANLTALDLSNNAGLTDLTCYSNQLTSLKLSGADKLEKLVCSNNQLTTLDLSNNPAIGEVDCSYNALTTLTLGNSNKLKTLDCYSNQLTTLDLSGAEKLKELNCAVNQLTTLDLSQNEYLLDITCNDNQLTELKFSDLGPRFLICYNNRLMELDLSKYSAYLDVPSDYCDGQKPTYTVSQEGTTQLDLYTLVEEDRMTGIAAGEGCALNTDGHTILRTGNSLASTVTYEYKMEDMYYHTMGVTLTVFWTSPPTLSADSAVRTGADSAQVTFTISGEDSSYQAYYAYAESGAPAPTVSTDGTGISCVLGQNTLDLTGLPSTEQTLYLVVKNSVGQVSAVLKVDIPALSHGSSGSTAYPITTPETEHGSVTVSPEKAVKGSTVTVTTVPDEGYELLSLTVTDKDGSKIGLTDKGSGKYTFTMPGSAVIVEAVFEPISPDYVSCDGGESCPLNNYTDTDPTAWYHDGVHFCLDNGMMSGYGNGIFGPNNQLSRAMLVQILYNNENRPTVTDGNVFDDVADGAWYADAVTWAAKNGIVAGYGDGTFGPENSITREQLAAIFYRYAQYKGYDVSVGEDTNILSYTDAFEISEYAVPAFQWACGSGIIHGVTESTLVPQGTATRAQVATMLMLFSETVAK